MAATPVIARPSATLGPRHREALSPRAQVLARRIAAAPWARDFYLAGGAALALYLGHRPVAELELATAVNRLGAADRGRLLASLLGLDPAARVDAEHDGCLAVRAGGGVPLRLSSYPYPLVGPSAEMDGLAVASAADLGLTMLDRLAGGGGSPVDLVELHLLCRELPLAELFARAGERFGHDAEDFRRQALQALETLARTPRLPRLAVEVAWQEVAAWVDHEVRAAGRRP